MSWLKRMALLPLVMMLQVVILAMFAGAVVAAVCKWIRHGTVT